MKITTFAATAAAALLMTACGDFTDMRTQGGIVPDEIENFRYLLNNTTAWYAASGLPDVMSDDVYVADGSLQMQGNINGGDYYAWFGKAYRWLDEIYPTTGYYKTDEGYSGMYNTIVYANTVINEIGNCSDGTADEIKEMTAEAKVHRADALLMLVNQYALPYNEATASTDAGVPLNTTGDTEQPVTRSTVQAVYDQIIRDLTEALPDLPTTQAFTTLPTKASAYGELARAYLLMGKYAEADGYAALALEQNSQLNDLSTMSGTVSSAFFPQPINDPEVLLLKNPLHSASVYSSTVLHLSDDLLTLLGEKDKRYELFTAPMETYSYSYGADGGRLYYFDAAMSYRNVGPSVPEMMLIRAEYAARNGQTATAMEWVNKLREKRFAAEDYEPLTATDADDALTKVVDERHREFFCRNLRWYDMRRLRTDSRFAKTYTRQWQGETYTLAPESNRYVIPIPSYQIVLNPELGENLK